ncbi:MAG: hypothetical protein RIC35_18955 [Marinoscillum sp.]
MKKIIIHVVYLLIIGFFVVFGNIKASEAEKNRELALANEEKAIEQAESARRAEEDADRAAAEARLQARLADDLSVQLTECKSK